MNIADFGGDKEVTGLSELREALLVRFGADVNELWLFYEDPYPALAIQVKGALASLHYFPEEGHPFFRSIGTIADRDGTTEFSCQTPSQTMEVPNRFVVPFAVAVAAAEEFLRDAQLPQSVEWMEL